MKGIGGNDRHGPQEGQGVHELLCAHLLGELDTAERARLDRELEASPELRAERARIAATIECVRGALGGVESLSPAILESIEGRAERTRPRLAGRWLRAAAVLAFCALGLFAFRDGVLSTFFPSAEERLARTSLLGTAAAVLPSSDPSDEGAIHGGRAMSLRELGMVEEAWSTSAPRADAPKEEKGGELEIGELIAGELGIGGGGGGRVKGVMPADGSAGLDLSMSGKSENQQHRLPEVLLGRQSGVEVPYEQLAFPGSTALDPSGVVDAVGYSMLDLSLSAQPPAAPGPATPGPAAGAAGSMEARSMEKKRAESSVGRDDGDLFRDRLSAEVSNEPRVGRELDRALTAELLLADCRRRPGERPSAMYFRFWGDNPFVLTQLERRSTFGADVDTASYALARRMLSEGHLPEKAQIRTEEFVNYFAPDVPAPVEDTFAIHTDLAPSRFGGVADGLRPAERWMLRVVIRGKEVARSERQPLALTFVIDVSGSMRQENRLELVKHSLRLLVAELDARDSIALVAFSNEARLVLPMTSAAQRGIVESAIHGLSTGGGTNAEAGLKLGYEVARASLSRAAHSRVVLLSDGVANIGQTDQDRINADVRRHREAGIFLNTVGVGLGNHNDLFLEQLANKGDGLCNYIDDPKEARRALVDNFTGAFQPIARDVKVQLELDPERVFRWRLLGYENRAIANQDFRNDAVDAGEVGAGHQVTALYELELLAPPTAETGTLATVRLRWKEPTGAGRDPLEDTATEREHELLGARATSWEGSSLGYKRAVLVAQLAEILRRSSHASGDSLDDLLVEATALDRQLDQAEFREFVAMVERTRSLAHALRRAHDPLETCLHALRRNEHLRAELDELRWDRAPSLLEDLERQNRELEARIRDLLRDQYKEEGR